MMALNYQFRPLENWPRRINPRKRATFRSTWSDTLKLLERELSKLQAKNIVIQADCTEDDIRNDGMLRANAKIKSPTVILSFQSKFGPLSYPCETYNDWQDNVRAIAKSLEALRSVDRYGVTRRAEQYKGWAKLPGPENTSTDTCWSYQPKQTQPEFTLVSDAADFLANETESHRAFELLKDINLAEDAYRTAVKKHHPDAGGDPAMFKRATAAIEFLRYHHKKVGA